MAKKSRDNILIPKATTSVTYKQKVANFQPANSAVTNRSNFENKLLPVKKTTPVTNFEPLINQTVKRSESNLNNLRTINSIGLPSTITNITCTLGPTDSITIESDKCVTVILNENITEQKYIKNISGAESLCVGTINYTNTFTNVVSNISELGFDVDTGLNVVCLSPGVAKVFNTGVTNLNNLGGAVTLSAGSNISIGACGNTLTFCSNDTTVEATPTTLGTTYAYNQTSYCNTYVGYCAGNVTSTGIGNIAIGQKSLINQTGDTNIALGLKSLYGNLGSNNIGIGSCSGCNITTGNNNTIIGQLSGSSGLVCSVLIGAGTCERLRIDDNGLCINGTAYSRVCSINSLFNNVTLSAGNNVSIGSSGNTLTFCSTSTAELDAYCSFKVGNGLGSSTGLNNFAFGGNALYCNTTGDNNVAIGLNSLYCNTTGVNNIAIGCNALRLNFRGQRNIALGNESLRCNYEGSGNIGLGFGALCSNCNGSWNVAIGEQTLCTNQNGYYNVAIGHANSRRNLTGCDNIAIGRQAFDYGCGNDNIAIGREALRNNCTGVGNIAFGCGAMCSNNGGLFNFAVGCMALSNNGDSCHHVALGAHSLASNSTGQNNIAIGACSLRCNSIASENIGIGSCSGCAITTGNNNTIIGKLSGTAGLVCTVLIGAGTCERIKVDNNGLCINGVPFSPSVDLATPTSSGTTYAYNQTSYCNTFVGYCAGTTTNTGSNNIAIGFKSLYSNNTGANNIAIGTCSGINIMTGVNNTIIGNLPVNSGTSNTMLIATGSTERLKVDSTGLYINQSGIGSAITLRNIYEAVVSMSAATGTVVHDFSLGSIFNHTSMVSNFTVNITNLNLSTNFVTNIILILNQGLVPYVPNGLQINGSVQTINWVYGAVPTGNSAKKDIVNFSITNIGGVYTVFGQLVTYG